MLRMTTSRPPVVPLVIVAVIAVVDGDKANAHEREGAFEIIARLNVITREAGKNSLTQIRLISPCRTFSIIAENLRTMKTLSRYSHHPRTQASDIWKRVG